MITADGFISDNLSMTRPASAPQRRVLQAPFSGKLSTPYEAQSVHDFMHAKVTVADDVVFTGSFNLSHRGEKNAENMVEIHDAELADRLAKFVDEVRARYPAVSV